VELDAGQAGGVCEATGEDVEDDKVIDAVDAVDAVDDGKVVDVGNDDEVIDAVDDDKVIDAVDAVPTLLAGVDLATADVVDDVAFTTTDAELRLLLDVESGLDELVVVNTAAVLEPPVVVIAVLDELRKTFFAPSSPGALSAAPSVFFK